MNNLARTLGLHAYRHGLRRRSHVLPVSATLLGRPLQSRRLSRSVKPAADAGVIIEQSDSRYGTMSQGFNKRWVGRPLYIQVVKNADEALMAVQIAVSSGLRLTIRGGGHCYEDFSSGNDGGVIVDLSGMNGVSRGPDELVRVDGGCTLWNVYETLYKSYNLTMPGGSCYSVGAGGHVAGGGYGLLSRLHGLVVDYLEAVDVVCVNARGEAHLVHAQKGNGDTGELLWAHTGGGGGTFGIVTAYYFKDLPRAPENVELATTTWPWNSMNEQYFSTLVRNFGNFMEANSAPESEYAGLFALLKLTNKASGNLAMVTQTAGGAFGKIDSFLEAVNEGVNIVGGKTVVETLPWLQATQSINGSGPNQRGKYKSAYLKKAFPEEQIKAIYEGLTDKNFQNPQALVQVDSYGCKINAVGPDDTAVPQRSSIMKLQYQTYWTNPGDDQDNLDWINSMYQKVYGNTGGVPEPNDVTDGCYINYPDVDLPESWPYLYYKESYPRLQLVKAQWDPLNKFNHLQSVTAPLKG